MVIRIKSQQLAATLLLMGLAWPLFVFPFQDQKFYADTLAGVWRGVLTIIGCVGGFGLFMSVLSGNLKFVITIKLPPFKKQAFSKEDIKQKT